MTDTTTFGSDDHLHADQIFLGRVASDPGEIHTVAGLGFVLLDCGFWRVFESADAAEATFDDGEPTGYLDTLDPTQFTSTNELLRYIRRLAQLQDDDQDNGPRTAAALPDDERGVH